MIQIEIIHGNAAAGKFHNPAVAVIACRDTVFIVNRNIAQPVIFQTVRVKHDHTVFIHLCQIGNITFVASVHGQSSARVAADRRSESFRIVSADTLINS